MKCSWWTLTSHRLVAFRQETLIRPWSLFRVGLGSSVHACVFKGNNCSLSLFPLPISYYHPPLLSPSLSPSLPSETGILVNDTIIGDPLFTVPMLLDSSVNTTLLGTDRPILCYEVHGDGDAYFNLVTDECASVNAHYINVSDYLNVIDEIAIRAVDMNGTCKNILVSLDNCSVTVNGLSVQRMYSEGGITISRMASIRRVRVSVPNCDESSLMMHIDCETRTLRDPFIAGRVLITNMMRFEVMRGLNFGHRSAHGLLGTAISCMYLNHCM